MHPSWKSSVVRRLKCVSVAVGFAFLSSAWLPGPSPDAMAANEAAAIETLRTIAEAQRAFVAAVGIDTNDDGVGEFGYLAELSGAQPMRVSIVGYPTCGVFGVDELDPPLIRRCFGKVRFSAVVHRGYVFQLWLPGPTVFGVAGGMPEDFGGGKLAAPFPDPGNGAQYWCCYAWPLVYNRTGRRAFVINQRDAVLVTSNQVSPAFSGPSAPNFDEAYEVMGDMRSPLRIATPGGNTGSIWWPVP